MMATKQIHCPSILFISLVLCALNAIFTVNGEEKASRWSRQISNAGYLNDWIPLQPRQNNGRVLNFNPFAPQQNGLDGPVFMNHHQQQSPVIPSPNTGEPFQRIFLQQMHPQNLPILPQNQQQLHVSNVPSSPFRLHHDMHLNQGPQHFLLQHTQPDLPAPQQNFRYPHFNAPAKPEFIRNGGEPSLHQQPHQPPHQPPHHEQLIQNESPQQLKNNGIEQHPPAFEMTQMQPPQEEVQLLYVPLDTLSKLQNTRYNVLPSPVNPLQINNNFYTHNQKFPASTAAPVTTPFKITTSAAKLRTTTSKPVHRFSFSSSVTESPKPKSHQPPQAMFMKNTMSFMNEPTVNDVLSNLIFSRSIDVIDSVNSHTPNIFIGPYGLNTPEGYTKFELPYLSSLELNRSERQISMLPFFVAPLSYRVPKGFSKIPLPSPHVGSVVVNSPNSLDLREYNDKDFYFGDDKYIVSTSTTTTTTTKQPPLQYFSYSTPAPERQRTATTSRLRYGGDVSKSTYRNEPEIVPTTPSTISSFNSYKSTASFNKPQAESVSRVPLINEPAEQTFHFGNKHNTVNNYATVSPLPPKQTIDDHKHKDDGPSKISLSNGQPINTTSFTYRNEEPNANLFGNYFTQTSTGAPYYNTIKPIVTTKQPEVTKYEVTNYDDRYSSYINPTQVPSTATSASASPIREENAYRNDEVEKMKSYFREQEAFKARQPIAVSTPASYYESSTSGTFATEKGFNEFSTIPSKLAYFSKEAKQPQSQPQENYATTPRTTVTYYTASAPSDESETAQRTKAHSVHQFRFVNSVHRDENRIQSTPKAEREKPSEHSDPPQLNEIFNTSPRYEPTRASYRERQTIPPYDDHTATYNIPSEISPIGANLPGLVNSLMEKDGTTPQFTLPTTVPTVSVTTRRSTISRGRRPQTTTTRSIIDDNGAPEITTRRPPRGRRPVNYVNRTTTARKNPTRSSNRVRFNPTVDERQSLNNNSRQRTRNRSGVRPDKEEENIDYQRDVLKQNYPVAINRSEKNNTRSTIDSSADQANKVYFSRETTVAPFEQIKADRDVESLSSVKEANYFGGKDDTVAINYNRISSKVNSPDPDAPIVISTTTNTPIQNEDNQEEITEVLRTRKPSFIRRVPSSTVKPATQKLTQPEFDGSRTKERIPARQKNYQESTRTVKPRTRGKRPNTFSQTTTATPIDGNTDLPIYKERKQNIEGSRANPDKKKTQFRFSLNAEESQWSTKFNTNSFQPINANEKAKGANNLQEVEIVTASPMSESDNDMYSFNVQANYFDFNKNKDNESASTVQPATNAETELSKTSSSSNVVVESDAATSIAEPKKKIDSFDESEKKPEKKGKRRGVWKRVRVRPVDSFEAAESQNLGKQLYNSLYEENKNDYADRYNKKMIDSTIESDASPSYDDMYDQVHTVLPMVETSTSPNDSDLTTLDIESIEATTEPFEKDERELESTSTAFFKSDDDDDATTTTMPFLTSESNANGMANGFESMKEEKAQVTEIMKESRDKMDRVQTAPSSSIMDEVKQKLADLFSFEDDDVVVSTTERVYKINRNFGKRPKSALPLYSSIDREPLINDIANDDKDSEIGIKSSPASMKLEPVQVLKTILRPITEPSSFHKELMDSVIYATSTSTEISHETEICYRGRCVKTQKKT